MKFTNYAIAMTAAAYVSAQATAQSSNGSNTTTTTSHHSSNAAGALNGVVPSVAGAAIAGALAFLV
ncbi:AaceriABL061CAp [[Ashbya] aceris (nom. inval.)]|nr:AaceriABL061CAp [[Ashbya] aceris (nom. inval.)]